MFVLQPNPTFEASVKIPTHVGAAEITFTFKHKGRKDLSAFIESLNDAKADDAAALAGVIAGWSGVDQEFSKKNLDLLIDAYPGSAKAIFNGYLQALMDGVEKN